MRECALTWPHRLMATKPLGKINGTAHADGEVQCLVQVWHYFKPDSASKMVFCTAGLKRFPK